MFNEKEALKNSKRFFLLLVGLSFFLLFFNLLGIQKSTSSFLDFLINPVQSSAIKSSNSVKSFVAVFSEVRTLRGEYYDLQERYLELKAEKNSISVLQEENFVLREQVGVKDDDVDFVLADVLFQDWALRNESLVLNKGLEDGVSKGDVVVVGNMYVGLISEAHDFTSKVRLPTSRASSLKVMIVDQERQEEPGVQESLSGVAVGHSNVLKVENIETHGELKEGFAIFTNDQKIGEHLYIGNVLSIDDDPTASLRSCTVDLPINYGDLKRVFVRKGGDI